MQEGLRPISVDVVMPVRNMRDLALESARLVRDQLTAADSFVIVDDASTDDTASALRNAGLEVLTLPEAGGPYAARHFAAHRSRADAVVFLDARSRPQPGWLEAHRALFADPAVALTCTATRIADGPGLAARVFRASNMFELSTKIGVDGRYGFYPTANLGVRRSAYEAVGGFRRLVSGGDADLCWRIQMQGLGELRADYRTLMEWVPRNSLRAVGRQWIRYGKSSAYLEAVYAADPATTSTPTSGSASGPAGSAAPALATTTRRRLWPALTQTVRQLRRTPVGTTIQLFFDALNVAVYTVERRRFRRTPPTPPTTYSSPNGRSPSASGASVGP